MMSLALYLASSTPTVTTTINPDGSVSHIPKPDTVSPGFAGFLTVFILTVVTILLIRSMVGHMRKVRYSPDPADPARGDASTQPR